MTGAQTLVENQLFATLDTLTRKMESKNRPPVLLVDTVGFIRKLPHHLVESFKATLSDIANADVCLHVIDAAHPGYVDQMKIADGTLQKIRDTNYKEIYVFNKIDRVDDDAIAGLRSRYPDAVLISAKENRGLDTLRARIAQALFGRNVSVEVKIRGVDGKGIAAVKSLLRKTTSSMDNEFCVLRGNIDSKQMDSLERVTGAEVRYLF